MHFSTTVYLVNFNEGWISVNSSKQGSRIGLNFVETEGKMSPTPHFKFLFCTSGYTAKLFVVNSESSTIERARGLQGDVVYLSWPRASLVYEPKCGGGVAGSQPMRTAVHITWHGAQINFGDLTPYLTNGISQICHLFTSQPILYTVGSAFYLTACLPGGVLDIFYELFRIFLTLHFLWYFKTKVYITVLVNCLKTLLLTSSTTLWQRKQ